MASGLSPEAALERLLPWFAYKYDIDAYEFWHMSYWVVDPYKYGWGPTKSRSLPNVSGHFVYPGAMLGLSEPAPSIRIVAAREGVEDYEIFQQLQKSADQGNLNAKSVLERIKALVVTPNAVIEARIAAGELLDQLMQNKIIVQE